MAFGIDKDKAGLIAGVIIIFLLVRWATKGRVGMYTLHPVDINANYINTQTIDSLPNTLACVVGPGESSGYYSRGLTPGGLCGDQKLIREQMRGYRILSGVGGSLLEK